MTSVSVPMAFQAAGDPTTRLQGAAFMAASGARAAAMLNHDLSALRGANAVEH